MIYEATIQRLKNDGNGNQKVVKEKYVLEEGDFFAHAETKLYEEFESEQEFDVTEIKRSKIKEIANQRANDEERLWLSEVQDSMLGDDGEEKVIKYKILFFSKTFDTAKAFITEYIKQGYGMTLVSLKLTKIIDVL